MKRFLLVISVIVLGTSACRYETTRHRDFDVHGIDISHYQSLIDWDTVAHQSIHFVFVKATEGESFLDSLYCHNWSEIKRVGLRRGAYHFFRPTVSAEAQFQNFTNNVHMSWGDLPPVLDVEVMDDASKVELITRMRTWLYLAEIKYRIKPIIYTNQKFYNRYLAGHFDEYPIWIARYNHRYPNLAYEREWSFWQYGNRGRLPGIEGDVDFNVFDGDLFQLEQMCWKPSHAVLTEAAVPYWAIR